MNPIDRKLGYFHRIFYLKNYAADLKATKLRRFIVHGYDNNAEKKVNITEKYARKTAFWGIMQETLFSATQFILVVFLIKSICDGRIEDVGMYMTIMLAFYRIDSKLHDFVEIIQRANSISLNGKRIRRFFNIKSTIEDSDCFDENKATDDFKKAKTFDNNHFEIEFRNVFFSYEHSEFMLNNLSLCIQRGEKVAIVGENGAGKTTLVKLLLRLYDVDKGNILINGKPIREFPLDSLRSRIGVAFQDTNIYAMSLEDNLKLYGDMSGDKAKDVLNTLDMISILKKNNGDLNSELTREFSDSGIILSGGEAQKIALARVFAHNFGLLLLDEPSSALDPIAEYKMTETILGVANKATTIIVAHRLSMIRNVNKIVVMDNGSVIEVGSHEELMLSKGKYYEMFTKQAENYQ